jgi:Alw26I/Eco31I/Esp3I family type II restriction m6 adenine DNA methyltransferase
MSTAYQIYKEIVKNTNDFIKIEDSVLRTLKILEENGEGLQSAFSPTLRLPTSVFESSDSTFFDAVELLGLLHQKKKENVKLSKTNLRKHLGIYYTPYSIAKDITDSAVNELKSRTKKLDEIYTIKFLEPCVGIGIFTIAYIESLFNFYQEIGGNDTKLFIDKIIDNIYACDIDDEAITLYKKVILSFFKYRFNTRIDIQKLEKNIYVGDLLFNTGDIWNFKNSIKNIFPEIFNNKNGFDVVITNPPYRLLKATSSHFDDESIITEQALNKEIIYHIKQNGAYRYANEGTLNYYKLFVEEMLENYSSNSGIVGILVPITLLSDKYTSKLRKRILEYKTTVIKTIPETNGHFPDITQSFCHFVINKSKKCDKIDILSRNNADQIVAIPKNSLLEISDGMSIFPLGKIGWKIIRKLHKNPRLKDIESITNLRGELDLTFYKDFITKNKTAYPLIRGAQVAEYSLKESNEFVDFESFSQKAGSKIKYIENNRLACQQISNLASRKRLKFCVVPPKMILGNSCNFVTIDKNNKVGLDEFAFLGILNSTILNWRFNISSTNNHINNYELDDLPIPFDNAFTPFYQKISSLVKKYLKTLNEQLKIEIDAWVFALFNLTYEEVDYICESQKFSKNIQQGLLKKYEEIKNSLLFNHVTYGLSKLDLRMVKAVPSGGNWKNIPVSVPSKRLEQIRRSGGRTTLYGRLDYNKPSYTISTYFTRPGNGTFIHPDDGKQKRKAQHRLISIREAARLQSFPDSYRFMGPKNSMSIQIGNAVPPLLGYVIGKQIIKYFGGGNIIDLFCGAGGLSHGFRMAGYNLIAANDNYEPACDTFEFNNPDTRLIRGDITNDKVKSLLYESFSGEHIVGIVGGPPCQGFSHAGKRMIDDPRNNLFKEFVEIVKNIKPNFFLMENVPGILTINRGKTFEGIKEAFKGLGYQLHPQILHAAEYGVPQKRKRVFILGSKIKVDFKFPTPILNESQFTTVKEALGDLPYLEFGDGEMVSFYNPVKLSQYQKLSKEIITPEDFLKYKQSTI